MVINHLNEKNMVFFDHFKLLIKLIQVKTPQTKTEL